MRAWGRLRRKRPPSPRRVGVGWRVRSRAPPPVGRAWIGVKSFPVGRLRRRDRPRRRLLPRARPPSSCRPWRASRRRAPAPGRSAPAPRPAAEPARVADGSSLANTAATPARQQQRRQAGCDRRGGVRRDRPRTAAGGRLAPVGAGQHGRLRHRLLEQPRRGRDRRPGTVGGVGLLHRLDAGPAAAAAGQMGVEPGRVAGGGVELPVVARRDQRQRSLALGRGCGDRGEGRAVHCVAEVDPRPGDQLGDRVAVHLHDLPDLVVGELLQVVQRQHLTLALGQPQARLADFHLLGAPGSPRSAASRACLRSSVVAGVARRGPQAAGRRPARGRRGRGSLRIASRKAAWTASAASASEPVRR